MGDAVRKIAVYLGLAEDDRYDEDDEFEYVGESLARGGSAAGEAGRRALTTERGGLRARGRQSRDPAQITTIHPRTYNEARAIGQYFREGIPVLMDLTEMSDDDAKRLVDFAAGLIFGRHGDIDRVAEKVFLLSPAGVEVMAGKKARTSPGG